MTRRAHPAHVVASLVLVALSTAATPAGRGQAQAVVPVPHPSLDGMEPAVARQLGNVRARLDRAIEAGTTDAQLFGDAGRHYHAYEMLDAAQACYLNAERLAPDDFRWPYLLAVVQQDAGRLVEAADSLRRSLDKPDRYYPAFIRLATIELELGRLDEAVRRLEPARAHAPDDPALLAVEGELALRERRYEAALGHLLAALGRQPRATRLHYSVAMAYRAMGRTGEARAHLAKAGHVGVSPTDLIVDEMMALRQGEPAYMIEGHAALRAGDLDAAATAFGHAVEASGGTSVGALLNLAAVEAKQGLIAGALDHLQQARRLAPGDVNVLYNLGVLLAHAGRHAEAEPVLRELAGLAPDDEGARLGLARTLMAMGKADEAVDLVERVTVIESSQCDDLIERLDALASAPDATLARRAAAAARRVRALRPCVR